MNKYNSESYAAQVHTPAYDPHICSDNVIQMTDSLHTVEAFIINLDIEPTETTRREANDERIERINVRYQQLFKKK